MIDAHTKTILGGVNRLLLDVYRRDARLSDLLSGYLDRAELERLREDCLPEFLRWFLFALRCSLSVTTQGIRLYHILVHRYGLDGKKPWTLGEVGEQIGLSRERIRQLQEKAVRRLRAKAGFDPLDVAACLAAQQVLGLERQPEFAQWKPTTEFVQSEPTTESVQSKPTTDFASKPIHITGSRQGKKWTPEEVELLRQLFAENPDQEKLAEKMGRSVLAVEIRLINLGLLPPKDSTPD